MKKLITILFLFAFASSVNYAASLFHIKGGLFTDGAVNIEYPCSAGGEPLVIYSTPTTNVIPISSRGAIQPAYVKESYTASPLIISDTSQTDETSLNRLIIQSSNPASKYNYVSFNLIRENDENFYVNSINFPSIEAQDDAHIVSMIKIILDGNRNIQSTVPLRMFNFFQDTGFYIYQTLHSIHGMQFSWDQQADWYDKDHLEAKHTVSYFYQPMRSNTDVYNGYGFWICGSDSAPLNKKQNKTGQAFYMDKK